MKKNLALFISFVSFASSQQSFGKNLPDSYLLDMESHGIEEMSTFDAPGATGYLMLDPAGQLFTAYALENSNSVVVGTMYDAEGNDLSSREINDLSLEKLESSDLWFSRGNPDAPYIYIVDDPMCGYCHKQYEALKNVVDEGRLQIRHLIVGVLGDRSERAANIILQSADPAAAFEEHHARFEEGGVEGSAPNYRQKQQIELHNQLMYELGVSGTPAIFYQDLDGKSHKIGGFTDDVTSILLRLGIE